MESIQIILCYRGNKNINYNYLACTTRDKRYLRWDYSFILCETTAKSKNWSCKIKTQWRRLCRSHKGSAYRAWGLLWAWSTGPVCLILSWSHVTVMRLQISTFIDVFWLWDWTSPQRQNCNQFTVGTGFSVFKTTLCHRFCPQKTCHNLLMM